MNVLIACEESQEVCKAFRAKGHRAFLVTSRSVLGVTRSGIYRKMCFLC